MLAASANIPNYTMDPALLLDFARPLDVALLDQVVTTFYSSHGVQQQQAQQLLTQFQDHPDSWTRADKILDESRVMQSKYLALTILERLIQTKWKVLPEDARTGIKGFIVQRVISTSQTEATLSRDDRQFLGKLNLVLVQILKQEWPHNWPNFIPELVSASRTSVPLCENNMAILKLLSEEVFDFSAEAMTQVKVRNLKNQMSIECSQVFDLCMEVLNSATQKSLIIATLATLHRFINWIPLGYIFETPLVALLTSKFLGVLEFRNLVLKCLTEIANLDTVEMVQRAAAANPDALPGGASAAQQQQEAIDKLYSDMFVTAMGQIAAMVPLETTNFETRWEDGDNEEQEFIQNLALFLTTFLGKHMKVLERDNVNVSLYAHRCLAGIARVDEREVFKVCLEFWAKWVKDLYDDSLQQPAGSTGNRPDVLNLGLTSLQPNAAAVPPGTRRREMYAPILSEVRVVAIERMVKPEEVLIVENDDGQIVRESMKEVDTIVLYKSMRECLVYLTHLDPRDTEDIMLRKLTRQIDGTEWSWANLNKLCWAVGSISGAMNEDHEKSFLVQVIKELLGLVDMKKGKDNKAVVASNIMYVVGQYPRFLKAHWRFLKTVVKKLFEFMHETHEGVQDMACDTYIKIAQKTRKQFTVQQSGEQRPFIEEILEDLAKITSDLQPGQVHVFFEATGYLVASQANEQMQERLVLGLMQLPNHAWDAIMQQAASNVPVLENLDMVRNLTNILRTNVSACTAIGSGFRIQMERMFTDLLGLYRAASLAITKHLQADPVTGFGRPIVRSLRSIKKETLKLVECYVTRAAEVQELAVTMVPSMLEACLGDYAQNPPQARDAEVLHVVASVTNRLGKYMHAQVGPILESVFSCTLEMINKELIEYPEHRVGFFKLIEALVKSSFPAVLELPPHVFQALINSIVWGFKHTMRDIGNRSLDIVAELFDNMAKSPADLANRFYQAYYMQLLQDVFFVLTDNEHKFGFNGQVKVLMRMMQHVTSGQVQCALVPDQTMPNVAYLRNHLVSILTSAFPHVAQKAVEVFVVGMFELNKDFASFKPHVRDFLIQIKEAAGGPGSADDLYLLEREEELKEVSKQKHRADLMVPGLVRPADREDDSD
ncbi:CRM1 C terminal-domain-containing protein [Catenaria anguillulae PL171]|uniref:CRM1 C terminal-domain-containing protein n=1 Tax=Catenaria anguillulae PL171 TaxID=765915 RepID=A0A1Y2HT74_9FUNG|nr:CRM1 C terminal-domain-containing protein [Catenaria anguillulae PL171]